MEKKYRVALEEKLAIYDEVVCNKMFIIKQEESGLEIKLRFKPQNFMHLAGFRYTVKRNSAKLFYTGIKSGNLKWNMVKHSNYQKCYTDDKLKVFKEFLHQLNLTCVLVQITFQ